MDVKTTKGDMSKIERGLAHSVRKIGLPVNKWRKGSVPGS